MSTKQTIFNFEEASYLLSVGSSLVSMVYNKLSNQESKEYGIDVSSAKSALDEVLTEIYTTADNLGGELVELNVGDIKQLRFKYSGRMLKSILTDPIDIMMVNVLEGVSNMFDAYSQSVSFRESYTSLSLSDISTSISVALNLLSKDIKKILHRVLP